MHESLWKQHTDWVTLAICIVVCAVGVVTLLHARRGPAKEPQATNQQSLIDYSRDLYNGGVYKTAPPDPQYPPPATTQANYYRTYTINGIQFNVDKGTTNIDRNPMFGPNVVQITQYNSANREKTPTGDWLKSISIGCIAMDKPYRPVPVSVKPTSFKPYEKKQTTLNVDIDCIYIGTADGKYFWRVYEPK